MGHAFVPKRSRDYDLRRVLWETKFVGRLEHVYQRRLGNALREGDTSCRRLASKRMLRGLAPQGVSEFKLISQLEDSLQG